MPSVLTTPTTTADPLSEVAERLRRVEESLDETGKQAREVIDSYKRSQETWREVSRNYQRAADLAAQAGDDYGAASSGRSAIVWGAIIVGGAIALASGRRR